MKNIPIILGSLVALFNLGIIVYADMEVSEEARKEVLNCQNFTQKQIDLIIDLTIDGRFSNRDYDYLYRCGIVKFAKEHKG